MLQSFLKKERWKDPRINAHESGHDKNNRYETSHTTKFTRYMKKEEDTRQGTVPSQTKERDTPRERNMTRHKKKSERVRRS